jgi:hypothetical protein
LSPLNNDPRQFPLMFLQAAAGAPASLRSSERIALMGVAGGSVTADRHAALRAIRGQPVPSPDHAD